MQALWFSARGLRIWWFSDLRLRDLKGLELTDWNHALADSGFEVYGFF